MSIKSLCPMRKFVVSAMPLFRSPPFDIPKWFEPVARNDARAYLPRWVYTSMVYKVLIAARAVASASGCSLIWQLTLSDNGKQSFQMWPVTSGHWYELQYIHYIWMWYFVDNRKIMKRVLLISYSWRQTAISVKNVSPIYGRIYVSLET